jgi:hypothetical protein
MHFKVGNNGGTEAMTILNNGNIGIGTTSPTYKLDVKGTTLQTFINVAGSGTGSFKIGTTGSGGEYGAMWGPVASPSISNYAFLAGGGYTTFNSVTGDRMSFAENNVFKMVMKGGNVGLGSWAPGSAPASFPYKLDVTGTFHATGKTIIDDNVGIGTTEPAVKLHVSDGNTLNAALISALGTSQITSTRQAGIGAISAMVASDSATERAPFVMVRARGTLASPTAVQVNDYMGDLLFAGYDGSAVNYGAGVFAFVDDTVSSGHVPTRLSFVTGTSSADRLERLTIKNNGNVGIGTTTPTAKLQIKGAGTTNGVNFQTLNSSGTALVTGLDNGNVGIGTTSPQFPLNVVTSNEDGIAMQLESNATASTSFNVKNTATGGLNWGIRSTANGSSAGGGKFAIRDETNGLWRMVIDNNGNVGIGTTTPTSLFSVGATSQFQVDSTGAIAAAAGITSSGSVTFSGLSTVGIVTNTAAGVLGTVSLVPIANGGTNATTIGAAGALAYSTGTAYAFSTAGTSGQALISGGTGAPTWFAPTAGSILFAGANGILAQDNTGLFYDATNHFLGLGTATPGARLDITGVTTEATIGAELITGTDNLAFTTTLGNWTGTGWSWLAGGAATHVAGANAFSLATTYTSNHPTAGKIYQLSFTINTTTAGTLTPSFGGANGISIGKQVNSEYQVIVIEATGSGVLTFTPNATWAGNLDNISVRELTTSTATQVVRNSDGTIGLEIRSGGTGLKNSFVGFGSGRANITGNRNSTQGYQSLYSNTIGNYNSALGTQSLFSNTSGDSNSAQGLQSLYSNTIGSYNSAYGMNALYSNTSGSNNSAQGLSALMQNTTGNNNSAQGVYAGSFIADGFTSNLTGSNSLFLGANSKALANGQTNQIVIGESAIGAGSNTVTLGNTSISTTVLRGNIGIGTASPGGKLAISQTATAAGALKGIVYTGAINTNQTLSTEISSVTLTTAGRQWATGALATQREVLITQPTYSFVGASTITNAATFAIAGAPILSTNATITNTHGLLIQAGAVGAATNSFGLTVNAQTGATNNYAAAFLGGNVGIGTTAPGARLDITGVTTTAVLGGELITGTDNTAFTTTLGNWTGIGWSWLAGGSATHVAGANVFSLATTYTSSHPTAGKTYQISFDINTTTAGRLSPSFGGVNGGYFGKQVTSETQTVVIVATGTGALTFTPNATWVGTLDNISVREVTPTTATQIARNSDGTIGLEIRSGGTGSGNSFIGVGTGRANISGSSNSAQGNYALTSNTTGNSNSAQGNYALTSNTTGNSNSAQGEYALTSNTTGNSNSAQGAYALYTNTSGSYNSAQGSDALVYNTTGSYNSAQGYRALYSNTTGNYNSAQGSYALLSNTTGSDQIGIGHNAGRNMVNVTANAPNIILGSSALYGGSAAAALNTGYNNIAMGYQAMYGTTGTASTGNDNFAAGNIALSKNTSGSNNIAIGNSALTLNTTGSSNLALGYHVGDAVTTGSNNILLGYDLDAQSATGSNQLSIGNLIFASGGFGTGTTVGTGNVGIGITNPTAKLHINGVAGTIAFEVNSHAILAGKDILTLRSDFLFSDDQVFRVQADGQVFADGAYTGSGADYAEYFYTKDTNLQAGEAVCLDPTTENGVKRCQNNGDNNIMGIVSSKPSIIGNKTTDQEKDPTHYAIIGMLGQVSGKVSTENGSVNVGDSLTAGSKPGQLRRANAGESTVGVALENLSDPSGSIQILISRRNQSLTVEKVTQAVTDNIAALNIQDQVDNLIAQASKNLDSQLSTQAASLINLQLQLTDAKTTASYLQAQLDLIKTQNQTITEFIAILDPAKLIYKDTLGNLDLAGGKLTATEVETGLLTIKVVDKESSVVGQALIVPAEKIVDENKDGFDDQTNSKEAQFVVIKTKALEASSRIFITPEATDPIVWSISARKNGESFTIKLAQPSLQDVKFNWWLVEEK